MELSELFALGFFQLSHIEDVPFIVLRATSGSQTRPAVTFSVIHPLGLMQTRAPHTLIPSH